MTTPRSHQLDIYGAWIHLATNRKDWRALKRKLPSLGDYPDSMGEVSLTLHETPSGKTIPHLTVWLEVDACDDQADLVNLIAHESAHAAGALLDQIGQAYDGMSEALAYLVGWIAGWLWSGCQA